ncbi:MAG: acetylxylan esterase [Capsulimonas sp.]|nr:acetylxylan esterase [Capsulimonas sp.]
MIANNYSVTSAQSQSVTRSLDPLALSNGERVTSKSVWLSKRRPELLNLFRTHLYGRMPTQPGAAVTFEVREVTPGVMGGAATRKHVRIHYAGLRGKGRIDLLLFVPTHAKKPAPVFLLACHRSRRNIDPSRAVKSSFWPAERIVERGYTAAVFMITQVAPDRNDGFKSGIYKIDGTQRGPDAWGAIAAWAWGCSRVMDYLQTDPDLDRHRVALVGHSRGGKVALWCGAEDQRFAMIVSNESGLAGAAVTRGKQGEQIPHIIEHFSYWFCDNYKQYADKPDALPVDQHELIALIAPRLVYVASASDDTWSDPHAEFLACVQASPVYELFQLRGLASDTFPAINAPILDGRIGYHVRSGNHELTKYDWDQFMTYADIHMK